MSQPIPAHLIELAADTLRGETILKTNKGWFDEAELYTEWDGSRFEATITIYSDCHETGWSLYEPPETVCNETSETERFVKVAELDKWARSHGFDIETAKHSK